LLQLYYFLFISQWYIGFCKMNFEWLTLSWLMNHLHWAVGILVVGLVILFFFPILLGLQLKNDSNQVTGE